MVGGGEARASICRAAEWPGRACPGWEARRETRRDGRGRCAAEEGDDRRARAVSERGRRTGVGGASDALGPGGRERARAEESGGVSGPSGAEVAGLESLGRGVLG